MYAAQIKLKEKTTMAIVGMEGLTDEQINLELQRGAKFVVYQYAISVVFLSFKRSSSVYFVKSGENAVVKGLPFTILSVLAGWWGIPFGPIFTVMALYNNLRGGKDVTKQLLAAVNAVPRPAAAGVTQSAAA
jgi:hypothetical protein